MNKQTRAGIFIATGVMFLFWVGVTVLSKGCTMPSATASEYVFPEPPYMVFGVHKGLNHLFCYGDKDEVVGNLALGQTLLQSEDHRWSLDAEWHHNSCAFSTDRTWYDSVGLQIRWQLWE